MKSKIFLIVLVAALAGGFYAYQQWNKPHRDGNAAADVSLSATELFTAFSTNEATANPKYLDKNIKVCGKVLQDAITTDGSTTVQLETGDAIGVVLCELDAATKQSLVYTKGQDVCFKGLCSGYTSDVVLSRCVKD
jgi:tRNA_anti-like